MDYTIIAATPTPPELDSPGNCYKNAAEALVFDLSRQYSDWNLVHGRPTLQVPPYVEYGHAWLESPDGEEVHDPSAGDGGVTVPAMIYYAVGNVNPEDSFKYSKEDARRMMVEYGHYGPWEGVDASPPIVDDDDGLEEEDDEY